MKGDTWHDYENGNGGYSDRNLNLIEYAIQSNGLKNIRTNQLWHPVAPNTTMTFERNGYYAFLLFFQWFM